MTNRSGLRAFWSLRRLTPAFRARSVTSNGSANDEMERGIGTAFRTVVPTPGSARRSVTGSARVVTALDWDCAAHSIPREKWGKSPHPFLKA